MDTFAVTLPGDLKPLIDAQVASGRYASADDFVRTIIERALSETRRDADGKLAVWLDEAMTEEASEWTPQDMADIRAEVLRRHAARTGSRS
jgi:antitoxin ParD1/3/4